MNKNVENAVARHNERMNKIRAYKTRSHNASAILSGDPLEKQSSEYVTTLELAFARACQH